MQEAFLHYVWSARKLPLQGLQTQDGQAIELLHPGQYNRHAGPDFFNAQLRIGDQLWAGNVEMHLKASDWYRHGHDTDAAYDNVILHVVWQADASVFINNRSTAIPSLELQAVVDENLLQSYRDLVFHQDERPLHCAYRLPEVPHFNIEHWLERLFVERLEERTAAIRQSEQQLFQDWEAVLFQRVCRAFGMQVNADAFEQLAQSIPFEIFRKQQQEVQSMEALLLGQMQLLPKSTRNPYVKELISRFEFLKHKYQLPQAMIPAKRLRLRPSNFPEIRLAQLAALYHRFPALLTMVLELQQPEHVKVLEEIQASEFWNTHYAFTSSHQPPKPKKLSAAFVRHLFINAFLPVRFSFHTSVGKIECPVGYMNSSLNKTYKLTLNPSLVLCGFI
ncbi:MAG: DUF2851 family protein [Flavobacteriaceae bacterium]|nr:DUF2851 family protein [Flavobacteriaceae bacterium]